MNARRGMTLVELLAATLILVLSVTAIAGWLRSAPDLSTLTDTDRTRIDDVLRGLLRSAAFQEAVADRSLSDLDSIIAAAASSMDARETDAPIDVTLEVAGPRIVPPDEFHIWLVIRHEDRLVRMIPILVGAKEPDPGAVDEADDADERGDSGP